MLLRVLYLLALCLCPFICNAQTAVEFLVPTDTPSGMHLSLQTSGPPSVGSQEAASLLKKDEPVERTMPGGGLDAFRIPLASNQYVRVQVEQRGIILTVKLLDQRGKEVLRMESPGGGYGPIYVSTIAEAAGDYRLEISSSEKWANAGHYEVRIEELRASEPDDRRRVAAEKAFSEASALRQEGTKKSREEAIDKFETARQHWETLRDTHGLVIALYSLGATNKSLGNLRLAIDYFDKALALHPGARDWRLEASIQNDRGVAYDGLADQEKALQSLNAAFLLYSSHDDRRGMASVYNNTAHVYAMMGKLKEAAGYLDKALPLRRAEHDQASEIILNNAIGGIHDSLGEPRQALGYYKGALELWKTLKNQDNVAIGYNNVAVAHDELGEWQQALDNYHEALAILRQTGNHKTEAATLDNIGELYSRLGNTERALESYRQALDIQQATVKDENAEANVLVHIGQIYFALDQLAEATKYYDQAKTLKQTPRRRAYTLTSLGAVQAQQGNPQSALSYYEQARQIQSDIEDHRGQAVTLNKMGEAYALMGDRQRALEFFKQAVPIWKAVEDQQGEASTLLNEARVERDLGQLEVAAGESEQALNIIDSLRTRVTSQQLRISYFATKQNYYELYIDIRMRLYEHDHSPQHLIASWQASERSRARSLTDTLVEAQVDITQGVDRKLIRYEHEQQQELNAKAQAQTELLNRKHTPEQAATIAREIDDLISQDEDLKAKIRVSSPKYAQLTQPTVLSLQEIQQLLDDDTLLLEYLLGSERSYVWLISKTSISGSASLPKRPDIETAGRQFYELLTAQQKIAGEPYATRKTRIKSANAQYYPRATALSRMLLGPLADQLGKKRLLIVSDGVLQYLPFSALPAPTTRAVDETKAREAKIGRSNGRPYLIEEHEIVNLPSAQVFALLRREASSRQSEPIKVAVIADPVFDKNDYRLKDARPGQHPPDNKAPSSTEMAQREGDNRTLRSDLDLSPLPASRDEAEAIKKVVPAGRAFIALDFEASRATVSKLQDGPYRIVHLATHGSLDTEHPELSGLVFSLFSADGVKQDGFLRLHDIYNLKLPVELVVLSACSTGLGNIIKGEGLIGLTRGFMYAGSPRIVASLWRVEDLATAQLMKDFYQHMFKENLSPAAALRQAQIEMLKRGGRQPSPFYWAGFTLQGEWRGIR